MGTINRLLGIQECQSIHGEYVDGMLELVHWFMLALGVGWSIFLAYVLIRYRQRRNQQASHTGVKNHASTHLEVGVIITEIILLLGFAFPLWGQRVDDIPSDPDVQIRAVGQQFSWNFHYAGPDGKFGNTNPRFINSWNSVGIDPDDPNGKDDVLAGEMVLPIQGKIVIGVTSKDVIHNLAVKGARVATDATPGIVNRVWFIPTKIGESEIICGQLCGPGHSSMRAIMNVMSKQKYLEWLKEQTIFETLVPGYKPKVEAASIAATPSAPAASPAPASDGPAREIVLGVIPGIMKFDKEKLEAKPGEKLKIVFKNEKDPLQHNLMICKPGTVNKVTDAANAAITNPDYMGKMQCFPNSPDILFKGTKLIGAGQSDTLEFTVPSAPGDYPYVCAFPGHAMLMRGVLQVKP